MTDADRAWAKVRRLIAKAKRERDKTGYREDLGYDQYPTLVDYLGTLHLSYKFKSQVLQSFDRQCDNL